MFLTWYMRSPEISQNFHRERRGGGGEHTPKNHPPTTKTRWLRAVVMSLVKTKQRWKTGFPDSRKEMLTVTFL